MSNERIPTKVVTGLCTFSYLNCWEPKSINGSKPKYSVSLIIPKSDARTVKKIRDAIQAAYEEGQSKLKGNSRSVPTLSSIKTPLRDGDSGVIGRASINFYAYNTNGNRGIACGLNNLQKIADGEPLGSKAPASDDFAEPYDDEEFLD